MKIVINNKDNVICMEQLREKLGLLPKKCQYKIEKGEVIILKLEEPRLYSA